MNKRELRIGAVVISLGIVIGAAGPSILAGKSTRPTDETPRGMPYTLIGAKLAGITIYSIVPVSYAVIDPDARVYAASRVMIDIPTTGTVFLANQVEIKIGETVTINGTVYTAKETGGNLLIDENGTVEKGVSASASRARR